jgi:hypothetical protein
MNYSGAGNVDSRYLKAYDTSGATATAYLDIVLLDAKPDAQDDLHAVTYGSTSVTGGVRGNDLGADVASVATVRSASISNPPPAVDVVNAGSTIEGRNGTLFIRPDGTYEYTLKANPTVNTPDSFTYTLRDADDSTDTDTATLTFRITNPAIPSGSITVGTVYEAALDQRGVEPAGTLEAMTAPDGSHGGEVFRGKLTYSVAPELSLASITLGYYGPAYETLTLSLPLQIVQPVTYDLRFGKLTIQSISNGVINYEYRITDNASSSTQLSEMLELRVKDSLGRESLARDWIRIEDDKPLAFDNT